MGRPAEEIAELKEAFTAVHQADLKEHVLSFCKLDETKAFFTAVFEVRLDTFFFIDSLDKQHSNGCGKEGKEEGKQWLLLGLREGHPITLLFFLVSSPANDSSIATTLNCN